MKVRPASDGTVKPEAPSSPALEGGSASRTTEVRPPSREVDTERALRDIGRSFQDLQIGEISPVEAVRATVGSLKSEDIQALLVRAELNFKAGLAKRRSKVKPGDTIELEFGALRPGQVQISFDHVREKVLGLLEKIDQDQDSIYAWFDEDDFPVVIGPNGALGLARDGHHKAAGLAVLSVLLHKVLPFGAETLAAHLLPKQLKQLLKVVPKPERLKLPAVVEQQRSELADDDAFFSEFDDPRLYTTPLYLRTRGGQVLSSPPRWFSELEDNPYRLLASRLVEKFKWKKDGSIDFKNKCEFPLWLKGPDAPDFVEFYVAEVLERVCRERDFEYRGEPIDTVPDQVRTAFHHAIIAAQEEGHPILEHIIAFKPEDINVKKLEKGMKLIERAIMCFDEHPDLEDDDVPIVILPSGSPSVHRLHAAARLVEVLVSNDLKLKRKALDNQVTCETIDGLSLVPDELGLWVNENKRTAGELKRNADLARKLALQVEPTGDGQLEAANDISRPVWITFPGVPESQAFVLGELWNDLFAEIDFDEQRLPTIVGRARSLLCGARLDKNSPLYRRTALVTVVNGGSGEQVAQTLRTARGQLIVDRSKEDPLTPSPVDVLRPRGRVLVDDQRAA